MSDASIVITRVLSAARELVWDAWMDVEQLAAWYGPGVFTNEDVMIEPHVGGRWQVTMVSPDGNRYPTGGEFIAIEPPERIVYRTVTVELSDQFGEMVRGQLEAIGADPDQEIESTVTVTFEQHDDGTLLTIHTVFPSEELRKAIANMRMEDGWNESLDTLESFLTQR